MCYYQDLPVLDIPPDDTNNTMITKKSKLNLTALDSSSNNSIFN